MAAAHEPGERRAGQPRQRHDVQPDLVLLAVHVERGERAVGAEPCVVDQQVEVAVGRQRVFHLSQGRRFGEIGRHRVDAHAVGIVQLAGELRELLAVARHKGEIVAVAREPPGECGADADGTAGDPGAPRGRTGGAHRASV
jgi:hypothetical protein